MEIPAASLCFTNETCGQNIFQSVYRSLALKVGVMLLGCQPMLQKVGQVMGEVTQGKPLVDLDVYTFIAQNIMDIHGTNAFNAGYYTGWIEALIEDRKVLN